MAAASLDTRLGEAINALRTNPNSSEARSAGAAFAQAWQALANNPAEQERLRGIAEKQGFLINESGKVYNPPDGLDSRPGDGAGRPIAEADGGRSGERNVKDDARMALNSAMAVNSHGSEYSAAFAETWGKLSPEAQAELRAHAGTKGFVIDDRGNLHARNAALEGYSKLPPGEIAKFPR